MRRNMPAAPSSPSLDWSIYCDGSAAPNPGRMGLGAVLTAPDGARHTLSLAPEGRGCNNEAELRAFAAALAAAKAHGARRLQVYSDNSVLVDQLGAAPAAPVARLADSFDEARALLAGFEHATVSWVPRHRNGEADALARAALGMAPKAGAKRWKKRR